jgi:hypothetical protein
MGKKLLGVLPKNQVEPAKDYKSPKERKRVEVEQADDGTFSIRCRGGESGHGYDYMGELKTAESVESMLEKVESHFGKSKKKD